MSRLTKKCGDYGYTVQGLNSVVKDNAEIICLMINKLAEYENLDLTPYELEEMRADAVCLYKENQQLKQRIDKLEALQPKFKLGEYFYYIERGIVRSKKLSDYSVRTLLSGEIAIFYWLRYDEYIIEEDIFKTEEEALAELERRNKN